MKISPLLNHINLDYFIEEYLNACGVSNPQLWLNTDCSMLQNPFIYSNIKRCCQLLNIHLKNDNTIGILVDCDQDGMMSSAIICHFLYQFTNKIEIFFHQGKEHGLRNNENLIQQFIDRDINLIIIPDAGSNDTVEIQQLYNVQIDSIILDHHIIEEKNISNYIVNPNLDKETNKDLSGTGVTFKFIQAYCDLYDIDFDISIYYGPVAISIISDSCSFIPLENKAFVDIGLKQIENGNCFSMLTVMYEQLNKKKNTPTDYAFGIIPHINSLFRAGTQEEKETVFNSLVNEKFDYDGTIKILKTCHNRQTNKTKKLFSQIEKEVDNSHKVIIGYVPNEDKVFTGLIANKLLSKYKKPSIVLQDVDEVNWSGSVRSPIPLMKEISATNFASCQGHLEAHGILLKKINLDNLVNWFDTLDISFEPEIDVAAAIPYSFITQKLCEFCDDKINWGVSESHGVTRPKFYIELPVNKNEVQIFKKKTNTIKIIKGKITFIKFMVGNEEIKNFEKTNFVIQAIVTLGINRYNNYINPQATIERYEIIQKKQNNNWEDLF